MNQHHAASLCHPRVGFDGPLDEADADCGRLERRDRVSETEDTQRMPRRPGECPAEVRSERHRHS